MPIRTSPSRRGLGLHVDVQRYAMREAVHLLGPADRDRDPAGPIPCRVVVGHIDDRETAKVLLGLGERPVGEYRRAACRVDAAHGGRRVQTAIAEDENTSVRHLLDQGPGGRCPLVQLVQREVGHPLVVEGDQVRRHVKLLWAHGQPGRLPLIISTSALASIDTPARLFPTPSASKSVWMAPRFTGWPGGCPRESCSRSTASRSGKRSLSARISLGREFLPQSYLADPRSDCPGPCVFLFVGDSVPEVFPPGK